MKTDYTWKFDADISANSSAKVYAFALFNLAKAEGQIDQVDQDLRVIQQTVREHHKLRESLADPKLPLEVKQKVVTEVFGSLVSPVSLSFFQLIVGSGKTEILADLFHEFTQIVQTEEKKLIAEVITAIPMGESFLNRVSQRLSKITGKDVKIRHVVDESILGGAVIRIGGKLFDGSLRHKLELLREKMVSEVGSEKKG